MRYAIRVLLVVSTVLAGCSAEGRTETFYVLVSHMGGERYYNDMINVVACGEPEGSRIDSTQFVVTVSSRNPFRGEQVPAVTAEVISSLKAKGYLVQTQPRICNSD